MPKWGSGVLIPWARGKMLILRAGRGWSPECAPTPDYRHGCSGQKLLCVLGWRGEGAGGMFKGGRRMVEHTEGEAWRWERGTCRSSGHSTGFPDHGAPSSAPLPHTRRALAEGLLGEVKRAVS